MIIPAPCLIIFSMVVVAPASSGTFSASMIFVQAMFSLIFITASCMAWLYPASVMGPPYSAPIVRQGPSAAAAWVGASVGTAAGSSTTGASVLTGAGAT